MANEIDYTQEDKVRALSPQDLARILILGFGSTDVSGIKLLGKKSDDSFEVIKTDDAGGLLVKDSTLSTDVTDIKTQTDKLAGYTPQVGSVSAAWQTAEDDVVSIGANDTKIKLHSLVLSIHNLVGTSITVRMYMQVNGTERKVYEKSYNATTYPAGLWIVNGTVGLHEVLRVTLESNNASDNNKAVDYDYMFEVM